MSIKRWQQASLVGIGEKAKYTPQAYTWIPRVLCATTRPWHLALGYYSDPALVYVSAFASRKHGATFPMGLPIITSTLPLQKRVGTKAIDTLHTNLEGGQVAYRCRRDASSWSCYNVARFSEHAILFLTGSTPWAHYRATRLPRHLWTCHPWWLAALAACPRGLSPCLPHQNSQRHSWWHPLGQYLKENEKETQRYKGYESWLLLVWATDYIVDPWYLCIR